MTQNNGTKHNGSAKSDNGSPENAKPSKVEQAKRDSRALRGTISETLASDATHFSEDEKQVLKFHGIYQQDDRDQRVPRRRQGLDKAWMFMVRLALPGGVITAEQYLALDRFADEYANGTLRITTRQGIQFHGVLKGELKPLIASANEAMMTTLAACGDVERNVMACPAPLNDKPHHDVQRVAKEIANELQPKSNAYFEIWVDGERVATSDEDNEEPFYGKYYLPRKFKTAIAIDNDNSVDVYAHDCGLIAITDNGQIIGYNLLVGGGFGMTHKKPDTVARLATPIAFVQPDDAVEAVRTVVAIFRDHGNRSDRRHARIKYLLEQWGIETFRAEFERRFGKPVTVPKPTSSITQRDYLGEHEQGDGKRFFGVFVQNGRIGDTEHVRMKTALREIVQRFKPGVRFTPMQSVLLTDLEPHQIDDIRRTLEAHGIKTEHNLSNAERFSMACPALPTCGLALSESERVFPDVVQEIENELTRLGLDDVPINIRMTGCPNGCARPYNADIGFVGRKPDVYHIYVGGGLAGDRMCDLFAADVKIDQIIETLRPLLERFRDDRHNGECLSDFYQRLIAHEQPRYLITGDEQPTQELVQLGLPQ